MEILTDVVTKFELDSGQFIAEWTANVTEVRTYNLIYQYMPRMQDRGDGVMEKLTDRT